MKKHLFLLSFLALTSCAGNKVSASIIEESSPEVIEKQKAQVVMLIGQSNASGVSKTEYLVKHFSQSKLIEYQMGYEKVHIAFQNEGVYGNVSPNSGFVSVRVGQGYNNAHFGPELGIAEYLYENDYAKDVFIIKVAYGGTGVARDWASPSYSNGYNGYCYDSFVYFANSRLDELKKTYDVEIKAFCWMQGEEDSLHEEDTAAYGNNESMFIADLREQFSAYKGEKEIGFIDAPISKAWTNNPQINNAKYTLSTSDENHIYLAEAENLSYRREPTESPDLAHFDSDAMITLGNLFGKALVENFLD